MKKPSVRISAVARPKSNGVKVSVTKSIGNVTQRSTKTVKSK